MAAAPARKPAHSHTGQIGEAVWCSRPTAVAPGKDLMQVVAGLLETRAPDDCRRAITLQLEGAALPLGIDIARGLRRAAAALAEERLSDRARAIEIRRAMADEQPDDTDTIEALAKLYAAEDRIGTLLETAGLIALAMRSHVIPYVVAVDGLGRQVAAGPADHASIADERLRRAAIFEWIGDVRVVTNDGIAQRKAIDRVYAHIANRQSSNGLYQRFLPE